MISSFSMLTTFQYEPFKQVTQNLH